MFDWNVTSKIRDKKFGRVKYKFSKNIISNDKLYQISNDLTLILLRKKEKVMEENHCCLI